MIVLLSDRCVHLQHVGVVCHECLEFKMTKHKFKIGQLVDFSPGRLGMPASSLAYKIIRLLPADGDQPQYRIKGVAETFERVARENDLSQRA